MLERVTFFFGEANPAATHLYASLEADGDLPACELAGSVVGPFCQYSQTLTATTPLRFMGRRDNRLMALAIVPDSCFWTPELPFLYRMAVELRQGGERLDRIERELGIRTWGVCNRTFRFDAKNWVLRAVRPSTVNSAALLACRSAAAAMWIDDPGDQICEQASRLGVLLVAQLGGPRGQMLARICELARYAAVGMIVADFRCGDDAIAGELKRLAPNLLFAQRLDQEDADFDSWVQVAVLTRQQAANDAIRARVSLPIVVLNDRGLGEDIDAARNACDRLQRDLADYGQFAGYVAP